MTTSTGVSNSDWNVLTVKDQSTITQNSGVSTVVICSKDAFASINGMQVQISGNYNGVWLYPKNLTAYGIMATPFTTCKSLNVKPGSYINQMNIGYNADFGITQL